MNLELVKGSGWHSLLTEQFIIRKTRGGKRGRERRRAKAELGKYKTEGQPDRQTAIRWQSPQVSDRKSSGFWRQKLHCLPYPGVYTLPIYPSLYTSLTLFPSLSLSLQLLRQTTCVGFTVYPRHQDRPKRARKRKSGRGRGGGRGKTMKMMTSADAVLRY